MQAVGMGLLLIQEEAKAVLFRKKVRFKTDGAV
jgi:hypothetical protein